MTKKLKFDPNKACTPTPTDFVIHHLTSAIAALDRAEAVANLNKGTLTKEEYKSLQELKYQVGKYLQPIMKRRNQGVLGEQEE